MTAITIERELLEQALVALSAPNHCVFSEPPICVDIRAALAAPAQPDQAFVCSLGCTTECLARQHGVPSECPSLPRQPVITPATAQAAEIARLRSESEERLQNCAALVAEVERLRKDAERYQWLAEYLVSDDESYDDAIVAATTVKEVDSVIDNAMKGTS
jgi:hypothetical protein